MRAALVFGLTVEFASSQSVISQQPNKIAGIIAEGENYQTEFYIAKGIQPGPTVMIDGGIHGDEIAGIIASDYLIHLTPLNGTLIVIPRMNKIACSNKIRFQNIEFNHCFPGTLNGKYYESRLAYKLTEFVCKYKPNYILSLHESRRHRRETGGRSGGQIIYYGVKELPNSIQNLLTRLNENLPEDQKFLAVYYPVNGACSEVWNSLYGCEAYAVETWRGYPLSLRVKLQKSLVLAYLKQVGMEFDAIHDLSTQD